ncbi:hypothetical protein BH24ACT26_BH24ACT26_22390 [soil metagenome]
MVPTDELEGYTQRTRARRLLVGAAVLVAAGIVAFLALRPAEDRSPPEFEELPLLNGGTLSSDKLEGSPVVLNFFASWCAPCRDEAPLLEATWRAYRDDGVRFIGVDIQDTAVDARRFIEEFDITYPVLRWDEDKLLARELGVYGLPQTFFIDHNWELLHVASGDELGAGSRSVVPLGAITKGQLEGRIQELLERLENDR